jgi:hypothetical protein
MRRLKIIHTLRGISTLQNLLEAVFCNELRSNITSSEEQSSSRRERNQAFKNSAARDWMAARKLLQHA